jgi:hypothetical protein
MGLKSLSKMNRSGVYDFWENSWESKILYKNYFFQIRTLQTLFGEIFNFFFFKYLFFMRMSKLGYTKNYKFESKIKLTLYFSRLWVLKYHNWLVLVVYYYNLNFYIKKKDKVVQTTAQYKSIFKLYGNYKFKF